MSKHRIIVFARCPDPGYCKTRLIPALGVQGAVELYEQLLRQTLKQVTPAIAELADVEVHFSGKEVIRLKAICTETSAKICYQPQSEGDLGQRLITAFDLAFQAGCGKVAIIGTDCPELDRSIIDMAFQLLDQKDVVLGPAVDGGYYLIALRQRAPELFHGIAWGQETVLETTLLKAESMGLQIGLLRALTDIDRLEDLPTWYLLRARLLSQ